MIQNDMTVAVQAERVKEIVLLMLDGKSKKQAAEEIGMPLRTLNSALQKHPEWMDEVIGMRKALLTQRLTEIAAAHDSALDAMIEKASNEQTTEGMKTFELIALEKRLAEAERALREELGISNPSVAPSDLAKQLLNGPTLRVGHAKITQTVEVDVTPAAESQAEEETVEAEVSED